MTAKEFRQTDQKKLSQINY